LLVWLVVLVSPVVAIVDLHVHSRYSRATSRDGDLEHLAWWGARKGIALLGTGDVTHPAWFAEVADRLVPAEDGLYRLRPDLERDVTATLPSSCRAPVRFLLSVEISTIYKRDGRTRKVHHLCYFPDLDAVRRFNATVGGIGNIASDGRPILGLDSRDLLEITLESGAGAYLVPAHVWTPWFAVLGSMSGFDAVADCYADLAGHVFAVETGLSSDPAMNWRVSGLDRYRLVSNSDAHSPSALGREATVLDVGDLDYWSVRRALETGEGFAGTLEFFPEEGKYHLDGHRRCDVRWEPPETRRHDAQCPGCGRPVTVGVLSRVEALADRAEGHVPTGAPGFRSLVQLPQVVGEVLGVGSKSKAVARVVDDLVERLGPELAILQDVPPAEIAAVLPGPLAEAVTRLRAGEVHRDAGYDGEYGTIRLFAPAELSAPAAPSLFPLDDPAPAAPAPSAAAATAGSAAGPAAAEPAGSAAAAPATTEPAAAAAPAAAPVGVLAGLDPEQREAAGAPGPLLIVAGPGTGKTRTLTHRLAHLVTERGVAPERCLAVTFTRRACDELRDRLDDLVPGGAAARITVATFHGLGLRIVRDHHDALGLPADVRVADEAERLVLAREAATRATATDRALLEAISAAKRTGDDAVDPGVVARYGAALRANGLVDFDDLAVLPVRLLERDPALTRALRERWPHLVVDEYQDVDALQYRLLRALAPPDGDVCAIGDPDQAIYAFRGGDVGFFLRFAEDFPAARTVTLTRNHRSSPAIVRAALQAVAPGSLVPGRRLDPVRTAGAPHVVVHRAATERAEAEFVVETVERALGGSSHFAIDSGRSDGGADGDVAFADIAVLARTSAQLEPLAEALDRVGMPYQRRTHDRLADRPEVAALLAALPRHRGRPDAVPVLDRLRAAAGTPAASVPADLERGVELVAPLARRCGDDLDRFLAEVALGAEVDTLDPRADRIALLTLHAAKGLEFALVLVVGCEDGLLPLRRGGAVDVDEERRLLFVGMTRARSRLVLSGARRRARHGVLTDPVPSPFLHAIDPALLQHTTRAAARARHRRAGGAQLELLPK